MKVVSNSTPLISLAAVGQIDILKEIFSKIIIPEAVFDEVVVSGKGLPGSREVEEAKWIEVQPVKDRIAVDSLRNFLDTGESEVIILAKEIMADLVLLDDKGSRDTAFLQDLKVSGTIGILLHAFKIGKVKDFRKTLDSLVASGFRLSETDYREILNLAKS